MDAFDFADQSADKLAGYLSNSSIHQDFSSVTQEDFMSDPSLSTSPHKQHSSLNSAATETSHPKQGLNVRSCVTCRKRKVRCDKHNPCSNCVKANIDCLFPPPGRASRQPRKPNDAELLKRLRRLENVVGSLGVHVQEDGSSQVHDDSLRALHESDDAENYMNDDTSGRRISSEFGLGRLVIKDGKSRYMSNEFWATLDKELSEIRNVLDSATSDEDEGHGPSEEESSPYNHHFGFLFGYSSLMFDMSTLHPNPRQTFILWDTYKNNIDPIVKIVHVASAKAIILKAAVSAQSLSKVDEPLFYSMCFAAIVSMTEDQTIQLLGEGKEKLMQRFRFAVEQALSRASFLNSSSSAVLQAFVMFLLVVKYIDTSRSILALSGLAMQLAQGQGLHRDGTNFDLDPYETEMRRRLWWQISLLDARAAEDFGADPTFYEHLTDTKMPLNINDDEIWPGMQEPPTERVGSSDMSFYLVRCELAHMQRKLRIAASTQTDESRKRTISEKEHLIDVAYQRMHDKYFSHFDTNIPILWLATTIGKLILAKMWLFVHHPRLYTEDTEVATELKERVFTTSVEVVEFGSLLEQGKVTSRWAWLFYTYHQWHAVIYVLSELCQGSPGPLYDRAWKAVNDVYDKRLSDFPLRQRGVLWKPLRQLYQRAKKRREQLGMVNSPDSNPDTIHIFSKDSPSTAQSNEFISNNQWRGEQAASNIAHGIGKELDFDFGGALLESLNQSVTPTMYDTTNRPEMSLFQSRHPSSNSAAVNAVPFMWTPELVDYFNPSDARSTWWPSTAQDQ